MTDHMTYAERSAQPPADHQAAAPAVPAFVGVGELVGPLRRQWRTFVLVLAFTVLGIFAMAWLGKPTYRVEAIMALPDVLPAAKENELPPRGIPLATYKKLERSITEAGTLARYLNDTLTDKQVESIRRTLGTYIAPLSSAARDQIERLDRADTIAGMRFRFESASPEHAASVVNGIGSMTRDTLITLIGLEEISARTSKASATTLTLNRESVTLQRANESLTTLATALEQLQRDVPEDPRAVREIVDVREGGYRYLPARAQLVGVRAELAGNEHTLRMGKLELEQNALLLAFLSRLDARLSSEFEKTGSHAVADLAGIIVGELDRVLHDKPQERLDVRFVRGEMGGLASQLSSYRMNTRFVQVATPTRLARLPTFLAILAGGFIAALVLSYGLDLVSRPREGR